MRDALRIRVMGKSIRDRVSSNKVVNEDIAQVFSDLGFRTREVGQSFRRAKEYVMN